MKQVTLANSQGAESEITEVPSRPRARFRTQVFLVSVLVAGCTHVLPAPEAPSRALTPELAQEAREPAPPGQGRLVLDVVGEPAHIEDLGDELDGAGADEICAATPCVVTLSVGEHALFFHRDGRDDRVQVLVTPEPRAHRRVLSFDSGEHSEYYGMAGGGMLFGLFFAPALEPLLRAPQIGAPEAGLITATAIAGASLIVGISGIIAALVDPRETRVGLSEEWQLE